MDLATVWELKKMFESARLKLTTWYLLIIMLISMVFSLIIYSGINSELKRFEQFWEIRLEREVRGTPVLDLKTISQARSRLILIFILINSGILATSALAGYFLAGKTLRPIKEMMDDQNRFVADASHELRTPLTAMKTEIEVALRQQNLTAAQSKKLLQSNLEEVGKMQNLSNYLLSLNRNQHNNARRENLNLTELTRQVITKLQPLAKKRQITFLTKLAEAETVGDKDSLAELLTILIENAIKYSHAGGKIKINLAKERNHLKLSVQDFGVGIKKEDQANIFKRFFRSDSSRTKTAADGYGLGLSIASDIVNLHHGKIEVKSFPGSGSTFIVTI